MVFRSPYSKEQEKGENDFNLIEKSNSYLHMHPNYHNSISSLNLLFFCDFLSILILFFLT